jgi:hypothetical protein
LSSKEFEEINKIVDDKIKFMKDKEKTLYRKDKLIEGVISDYL